MTAELSSLIQFLRRALGLWFRWHRYGPLGVTWTPWCKKVYIGPMHFGRLHGQWNGGWS